MRTVTQLRTEAIDGVLTTLRALASSGKPIVVGPWLGEIGFELLYWIPFVRWAQAEVGLLPEQLTVISRGGCQSWYADITSNYVELYDHYSPAALKEQNERRVIEQGDAGRAFGRRWGFRSAKQYDLFTMDREILARMAPDAAVFHPSLMYHLFRWYWRGRMPGLYARCARVKRIAPPPRALDLPPSYIAVKFYSSMACTSNQSEYRRQVNRIVKMLVDVDPVVLLDSGSAYDEHGSFAIDDARVIRPALEPRTNLATQTAIIARASSFVGTYGGFAYLAPLLKVPTTAFYADRNFRDDHLNVATRVFDRQRVRFAVMPLDDGATALRRTWRAWTHAA